MRGLILEYHSSSKDMSPEERVAFTLAILDAVPMPDTASAAETAQKLNSPRWQAAVARAEQRLKEAAEAREANEEAEKRNALLGWNDVLFG